MLLGKVPESLLGVDCLLRSETSHQVDVLQTRVMFSKDRGGGVSLLGKQPLELGNETHLR
jgi:hypothetical protein